MRGRAPREPVEQVAIVAASRRELLLHVHRFRLRREDLEDCYSQATLELVVRARQGGAFASDRHIANAAAAYLRASGAPANVARALFAYNHAGWYVAEVERWAARYRAASAGRTGHGASGTSDAGPEGASSEVSVRFLAQPAVPARLVAGERAELASADGHVALAPADAPPAVQAMVMAGNELQDLPYGPAGHPDPRGASEEDCSSTVNYVLYRAGVRPIAEIIRENPLAQDYVDWGAPGPGRWVTIYATNAPTAHVFMIIAGLRLDTSHNGTDIGPNRGEDGPRWRLLDHVPTWARWAVRHPPGL